MSIRYQADNDLRTHFVRAVRRAEPAIDFKLASASALDALSDIEVLRRCAIEGRILVSHDKRTLPKALAALLAEGPESPGIILVIPQSASIRAVAEDLILIWSVSGPEEWRNRIVKLPF